MSAVGDVIKSEGSVPHYPTVASESMRSGQENKQQSQCVDLYWPNQSSIVRIWSEGDGHGMDLYNSQWLLGSYRMGNGQGYYVYGPGGSYSECWQPEGQYGQGTFCVGIDGNRYVGQWCQGTRQGLGIYALNGDYYIGDWWQGKEQGLGIYAFRDGDYYIGGWWQGKRQGLGVLMLKNGIYHHGTWHEGKKCGRFSLCQQGMVPLQVEFEHSRLVLKDPIDGITCEHIQAHPSFSSCALIIQSTADHNGIFSKEGSLAYIINKLEVIAQKVIVKTIGSIKELHTIILEPEYKNRVCQLWIRAHGNPISMDFHGPAGLYPLKPLLDQLAPASLIVLESCETGSTPPCGHKGDSIAQQMADYAKATVIAPNCLLLDGMGVFTEKGVEGTTLRVAMLGTDKLTNTVEKCVGRTSKEPVNNIGGWVAV